MANTLITQLPLFQTSTAKTVGLLHLYIRVNSYFGSARKNKLQFPRASLLDFPAPLRSRISFSLTLSELNRETGTPAFYSATRPI